MNKYYSIGGLVVLALLAWFFRYSISPMGDGVFVKYDRWTQTTYRCSITGCYKRN